MLVNWKAWAQKIIYQPISFSSLLAPNVILLFTVRTLRFHGEDTGTQPDSSFDRTRLRCGQETGMGAKPGRGKGFSVIFLVPVSQVSWILMAAGGRKSSWEKVCAWYSHPAPNPSPLILKTIFVSWSLSSYFCVNSFLTRDVSTITGEQQSGPLFSPI